MERQNKPKKMDNKERLKEIVSIFTRHEIVKGLNPQKLRMIIEDLGPAYIKLGQILSMHPDIIPKDYCQELSKLTSHVKPMAFDEVKRVVEASLACSLDEVFPFFSQDPLGSASIAQVHRAQLQDGSQVVVKVQREGIRETMAQDISLMHKAAALLKLTRATGDVIDFHMILDEMWAVAQEEMDFLTEASNAEHFAELNQDIRYSGCPKIYRDYTASRVLVMEYIRGSSIGDTQALIDQGYDLKEIAAKLTDHYLKQIIEDGFFHADPHPGNIRICEGKIIWIDLGMMGHLSVRDRNHFGKIVAAIACQDEQQVAESILALGESRGHVEHTLFYADIDDLLQKYGDLDMGGMDLSKVMEDLLEVCKRYHIAMPSGFSMLARGLATLEGVISVLDPEMNVIAIASSRMSRYFWKDVNWRQVFGEGAQEILESTRKSWRIPGLTATFLKRMLKGQTSIHLELGASDPLIRLLSLWVDKLIAGILVAALLISSSVVATTNMRPQILDIPALGALGYAAALVLFIWIFYHTIKRNKK